MNGLNASVIRIHLCVTTIFLTLNGIAAREFYHRSRGRALNTISDMDIVGDIKRALYFDADIDERDSFMEHALNLRNSNPTYMFILPNKKRTKLIMKRTDFNSPIFPNVSELSIKLGRLSAKHYFEKDHLDESPDFTAFSSDDSDNNNMAWENVQTEQTFIDYMERLNERADSMLGLIQERKLNLQASNHRPVHKNQTLEWQNIGLDGWKGEIALSEGFSEDTISERLPETDLVLAKKSRKLKAKNALLPQQWNFLDSDEEDDGWDLPGKVAQDGAPDSDEVDEVFGMMLNGLNDTGNVEWPIANARDAHKSEDVYIGRANDPFGYSTKWEFRSSSDKSLARRKRGIFGLYSILKCATGCDPLLLRGYGCYCGFMGAGIPADGIDRCCQAHDQCYGRTRCPMYLLYFVPYLWKCYNGQPLCAIVNGEWGSCAAQLCRCDLKLSLCTRKYRCPRRRAICWSNKFRRLQNFLRIL